MGESVNEGVSKEKFSLRYSSFDDAVTLVRALGSEAFIAKSCLLFLSLIGSLSFAAKVVKPGSLFLRRLIDLSNTVTSLHHHVYLNTEGHADIWWWVDLPTWNVVSFIKADVVTSVSFTLFTDVSGSGFGAVYDTYCSSVPWPASFLVYHININYWVRLFLLSSAMQIFAQVDYLTNAHIRAI